MNGQPVKPPPSYPGAGLVALIASVRKAVTAVVGIGLTYAILFWGGNPTDAKWIALATGIASALGVYSVPNSPKL